MWSAGAPDRGTLTLLPETHFARGSGEGWSGEERRVLNRFVGGMAIVRVRSRRKEHGRTNGSSVLYIANWPVAN